jgi:hypothetical protein
VPIVIFKRAGGEIARLLNNSNGDHPDAKSARQRPIAREKHSKKKNEQKAGQHKMAQRPVNTHVWSAICAN